MRAHIHEVHMTAQNFYIGFWGEHCLKAVFQTLRDYSLAQGLAVYTQFDDLDLISRSQGMSES